jgi:dTDP-4-dehydrorhamnose 3,5-epimerase
MDSPVSELELSTTPLAGVMLVRRRSHLDNRGRFARLFCSDALAPAGWSGPVAQINHSVTTTRGTVRGLHYQQAPFAEMKLVSCVRGQVWDVAVDLRRDSPTFGRWHAQALSPASGLAMLIPHGCAHGFQALSDDAELLYCHSAPYAPQAQGGVFPGDPRLAISWPLPIDNLSERDAALPALATDFMGVAP